MKTHKTLVLAALLAISWSARADIILTYHISAFNPPTKGDTLITGTQIPNNDVLGPALTGPNAAMPNSPSNPLFFAQGEVKYLQIAINANANAPTTVGGANQFNWGNPSGVGNPSQAGNTMITFGFAFNYPSTFVTNPFTTPIAPLLNDNNTNVRSQSGPQPDGTSSGYAFATSHPNTYPSYNMGGTAIGGLDTNVGLGVGTNGFLDDTILAVVKVRANMVNGVGVINLTDLNSAPTASGFSLVDGTNLDEIIFAPSHAGFPLFIRVVPEPSSMCLAGLAVIGFGWRKLRRKNAATAV